MGTRKKTEIANRRREVSERYLRGEYQPAIAEALGVNQSTISRDIKALQKEWLKSSLVDFNDGKSQQLAKIDNLEREYWDAWYKSQEDAVTVTKETTGDTEAKKGKIQQKTVGQVGNPAYLRGVEWCINKRCEILGLDAPEQQEHIFLSKEEWRENVSERRNQFKETRVDSE